MRDVKNEILPGKIAIGCGLKGHRLHRGLGVNVFPLEIAQTSRLLVGDLCWRDKVFWSSTRKIKPQHAQKGSEEIGV